MSQLTSHYYLHTMGIQPWVLQKKFLQQDTTNQHVENSQGLPDWDTLAQCVKNCVACNLHKTRTQTVFGSGDKKARLMIIGEAPGATEDKVGQPFVGRAGQLLDEMLHAIGFKREQVFIANILKCRPPNNRDPLPEEVEKCSTFLTQQVQLVQPKLILALGRVAAHNLLHRTESMANMRGKPFYFSGANIPVRVSYHPAYLLRSPADKRKAYEDLQWVYSFLCEN